jgi:hypothetical protein
LKDLRNLPLNKVFGDGSNRKRVPCQNRSSGLNGPNGPDETNDLGTPRNGTRILEETHISSNQLSGKQRKNTYLKNESKVAYIDEFDGKVQNLEKFLRDAHLHFQENRELYDTDATKIIFILSLFTKDTANSEEMGSKFQNRQS